MIKSISERITGLLIDKNLILVDEMDVYSFGAEIFISYLLYFFTTILIGFLFNIFAESIIFYFSYLFIRIYVGGYHASTYKVCYIISLFITTFALTIISRYSYVLNTVEIMISMILAGFMINFIGPVEDKNKKLTVSVK